jgi:hypothetical protein
MNNVIAMVNDLVKGLTSIFMGLLGLGVLAGILFGDLMGVDVVGGLCRISWTISSNFTNSFIYKRVNLEY